MQVTRENLPCFKKRVFLAFTLILLLGNSAQGAPLTKATYQWVRCTPDSKAANCIKNIRPLHENVPSTASIFHAPGTNPYLLKKYQEQLDSSLFSEEESGSGIEVTSGAEPAVGSGMVNDADYNDFILNQVASVSE
ncbi:serglycin [Microcaecilia unicolor]|uniref:Serglycin n=1 Tax=Microcaecilia unicolor TaxID=1415580 RepID=A0A6P7Y2E8_9AMPH|nr:serglycin [Microcaecilia unicolor]